MGTGQSVAWGQPGDSGVRDRLTGPRRPWLKGMALTVGGELQGNPCLASERPRDWADGQEVVSSILTG